MRTQQEIDRQIDGLEESKKSLPEYSYFGTPNHKQIDAQISILDGSCDFSSFDEDNDLFNEVQIANFWMDEEYNDDLF